MAGRAARTVLLLMAAIALGAVLGAVTKFGLGHELKTDAVAKPAPMRSTLSEP